MNKTVNKRHLTIGQIQALIETHDLWMHMLKSKECDKDISTRALSVSYFNDCPLCSYIKDFYVIAEEQKHACKMHCPISVQEWGTEQMEEVDTVPCQMFKDSPWVQYYTGERKHKAASAMVRLIERILEKNLYLTPITHREKDINPIISWALRNGKYIKCIVWDFNKEQCETLAIRSISDDDYFKYKGNDENWTNAEPILHENPKQIVKDRTEIVRQLLEDGYEMQEDGSWYWYKPCEKQSFAYQMFEYCGKEPHPKYIWNKEWLVKTIEE